MNYSNAESYCLSTYGTHLATIESSTDNTNVQNAATDVGISDDKVWIGYNDIDNEGIWMWINDGINDTIDNTFTNWHDDEPNNSGLGEDCAQQIVDSGLWNDDSCSKPHTFVCNFGMLFLFCYFFFPFLVFFFVCVLLI